MRRISPKLLTAAHAAVDSMLAESIVEPSESPWSSYRTKKGRVHSVLY